jgi:hypothetical protein
MVVVNRQQFLLPGRQPILARVGLALRTVTVSAGVIGDGLVAAAGTPVGGEWQASDKFAVNMGLGFDPGDPGPEIILKNRLEWRWGRARHRP